MTRQGNNILLNYFNTWKAVAVFIILLLLEPAHLTFMAIRPSDVWLLIAWYNQMKRRREIYQDVGKYSVIKNYGLIMGIIAVAATMIQALYIQLNLEAVFFYHFYKFYRYVLILQFIRNIYWSEVYAEYRKILNVLVFTSILSLIMIPLEYYTVEPFNSLIVYLYTEGDISLLQVITESAKRAGGNMGNSNSMGMILTASMAYPVYTILQRRSLVFKGFALIYVVAVFWTELVYLGSRTALLAILVIPMVIMMYRTRSFSSIFNTVVVFVALFFGGAYLYDKYKVKDDTQERVIQAFESGSLMYSSTKTNEWTTRVEMWQDRVNTLFEKGNPLAFLIGLGYTKVYKDYADNGLVSAFANNGLIGLILKLVLYYTILHTIARLLIGKMKRNLNVHASVFIAMVLILLMFEITADLLEHHRLGPIFFTFFSIVVYYMLDHQQLKIRKIKYQFL